MDVFLVSHFHWDREWYRPMEAFRARLVDAVDAVLDLLADDPGYCFVLDGQAVVIEDYLAIRPGRRGELETGVRQGRLGVGPWYVQPDSLLPSGEAHVRNLLIGRRVARQLGPVSTVAYVPDSFGHPAQFPQLLRGFGLDGFVYWRGNGSELDRLGPRWCWRAPDGSEIRALHLTEGYFGAAALDADPDVAAARLAGLAAKLAEHGEEPVLLMNGFDHLPPDSNTGEVTERLTGQVDGAVRRALLDDAVAATPPADSVDSFEGELVGGRIANLLQGVWSARMPLKLRNRRIEALLEGWAEPFAALGEVLGLHDEHAALDLAWRSLLKNQAHDSICGCSTDATHERMIGRYDDAERLGAETLRRLLERLAGRDPIRRLPESVEQQVVVFNPSPHPRSDVVRVPIAPEPAMRMTIGELWFHPLMISSLDEPGFSVDGRPARVIESTDPGRLRWIPGQHVCDVEFVAEDVPPFGCRRYRLQPCEPAPDDVDDGLDVAAGDVGVSATPDGRLDVRVGGRRWDGLFGIEDHGDRGDSYDFDPVGDAMVVEPSAVTVTRTRHPSGIQTLTTERTFGLPAGLETSRDARSSVTTETTVITRAVVAPGLERVDVVVEIDNRADDHRLRLLFPTGSPAERFRAASTFDVVERSTAEVDDTGWIQPAPTTFCHHGFVEVNGLVVAAPGLPEAEVTSDGVLALTLVRGVGWLARMDLRSRPLPAGPLMEAAGAQVPGRVKARISILPRGEWRAARDAELGMRGVLGGPSPRLDDGRAMVGLSGEGVVLSALKPADDGDGVVIRLLNTTGRDTHAALRFGFAVTDVVACSLDEQPLSPRDSGLQAGSQDVQLEVPAHALRSLRLRSR